MYKYDNYDQAMVDARVADFRDQVKRRLSGEMTEDQFKPLRLMNGLYLQLHAYMLRVAIPYGTLDSRRCGCWRTSRANMIAATAISPRGRTSSITGSSWRMRPICWRSWQAVEMHAIQTSGNCIRNISASDQYRRCCR
jgi:sulfite reductase (NADPH) hemoprotein beta-component